MPVLSPRSALPLALLLACGPAPSDTEGSGTALPEPTASSGESPTGSTTVDLPTGTGTADSSGTGGITSEASSGGTDGGEPNESVGTTSSCDFDCSGACDPWAQDCGEGLKCAAWARGGGSSWNSTKCVPAGDRLPGESCTAEGGGVSGIDDCVKGAMCWDVDDSGVGTCVAQCTGSEGDPICADGFVCPLYADGVLILCFPRCDPLGSDCEAGDVCIPTNQSDDFLCAPDQSGEQGQVNDPCSFATQCDPGLICLNPQFASSACDPLEAGCCQPFCEFPGAACPNPDQACVQFFDPERLPPNDPRLAIGVCGIP